MQLSLDRADTAAMPITHEVVEETDRLPVFFSSAFCTEGTCWRCGFDGLTVPVHWHEYIEFIYLLEGHMTAVVQADSYELDKGDLLIINSGDLHMTRISRPHTPYVLIQLSAKRLREIFPDLDMLHFTTCIKDGTVRQTPKLYDLILSLKDIFDEHSDGYQLLFSARFYEFLYVLYRHHSCWTDPGIRDATGRDLKRVTNIIEWTQENFRKPLTLNDAADHLGISREYFCRIFKKYTGQTYLEYLCATRTMNLYDELKTSNLSIPLLMEQNGLTNYKTFIRTFKELYGTTPQKVRKGSA